jgi:hypothetical protein
MKIYRQGDVLIKRIRAVPQTAANKRESGILAFGEVTGHCHKVEHLDQAEVLEVGSDLYLRVSDEGVRIVHDEHAPISLPSGDYQVTIQREYTPQEIRNVAD